jgi:diguanylate cyclase (GGDEF)-like protein
MTKWFPFRGLIERAQPARRVADAVATLTTELTRRRPFASTPAPEGGLPEATRPDHPRHPASAVLDRLGLVRVTVIATVASAVLSLGVASLFGFVIDVPDYRVHMLLAFVIPFFVTPLFSYLIALGMRDLQRAKARSRDLAAQADLERTYLHSAVNNMPIGLVMFDAGKRLIVCNDQYRSMYDLPHALTERGTHLRQMLEHRLSSGNFEGDREAYIERILKLVEQKETSVRIVELGNGLTISIIHHPIETGGWVGTHEDVTERQRLNAKLEEQNKLLKVKEGQLQTQNIQLDAALNNMVQGLAMFGADQRLVLCNQRYREIYGLRHEQTEAGTPLHDLIEPGTLDVLRSDRSASQIAGLMPHPPGEEIESTQFHSELADGRCIAISAQPMPDGGTVTTHQDITEQRRSEAKIAHMALHDSLTGLANRVLINERLAQALARARRGELVAVHLLDLDRFKSVNDTLGHPVGDTLLRMVTERLLLAARETDTVARMGGDEFAIVQVGISQPADATALAQRTIEEISRPYSIDGHHIIIGTSVGIAVGPGDGDAPDQLVRNADLALYRAKSDGRGTFRFFERAMDAQMQDRRAMEHDLHNALIRHEFELYYQPIVALESNDVCGFEALIRWHHPDRGLLLPASFIALAEEIGLIVPLGEWIIRQACAAAATWPDGLQVAVNLSPVQFGTPGLVQIVVGALAAVGLDPRRLELEITESTLLQNNGQTLSILHQLRELGVRIALDDFGTGYSSLSYLQSFPFDKIKIDRSFIEDISSGSGARNIVRAVATMAAGLGMTATAEGVETTEQLEAVRSEGCGEVQGYYFSKPLEAREIDRMYLSGRRAAKRAGSGNAA